jgi:hypothetical protein
MSIDSVAERFRSNTSFVLLKGWGSRTTTVAAGRLTVKLSNGLGLMGVIGAAM